MVIKIDVDKMDNGMEVASRLRGNTKSGIPWMTILDADGAELINSDAPRGNIGCPVKEGERAYFMTMLRETAQHSSTHDLDSIKSALQEYAATLQ